MRMAQNAIPRRPSELFNIDNCVTYLSHKDDGLHRLDTLSDWKGFVTMVDPVLGESNLSTSGWRPAFPVELMLKILIVQRLYNLSDAQTEFQANDRLSFETFLGLTLADRVPDQNVIWGFREALVNARAFDRLFELFNGQLLRQGLA